MTEAQRKAAAKKAAATRAANRAAAPGAAPEASVAKSDTKGPERTTLPDGKRPHDTFTWADAIACGLVKSLD